MTATPVASAPTPAAPATALEPVRAALLAAAAAEADRVRAEAEADARRRLAAARGEAEALLAEARSQGAADASWVLAAEETEARRAARGVVLSAQRDAYERLRRESVERVRALLVDPSVREDLAARLLVLLPGAAVHDLEGDGLSARTADGRSIDASPEALVERVLPSVDGARLWSAP
ncbi:hypothetical protein ACT8ZV_05115 [Nocardioides sp. MAHUQ-72]|uniref:hypothetical protein n=1 Tax=unclassified Nocardioides TaxID=2615069 RepID=UPI0036114BEB